MDDETREQFARVESHFERVEGHFERIEEKFQGQFDRVGEQFQRLFDFLDRRFTAIDTRFERLEEKVDRHHEEALTNFDALFKRDEDRQTEYQVIKAALSRVEISEASIEIRVAAVEAALRGDHDA